MNNQTKKIIKKTFWILFWIFWIIIGLILVNLALSLYFQIQNPDSVGVDGVHGIIQKIAVLSTGVVVTTVGMSAVFGLTLILLGIYLLITLIIFLVMFILRKRKRK